MFTKKFFKKQMHLEQEISSYLNNLNEICSAFNNGVKSYLDRDFEKLNHYLQTTSRGERKADQSLKDIKYTLYANSLYPDFQKDITLIFDKMDNVADISNQVLVQISLEQPLIPDYIKPYFKELVDYVCRTSGELVNAAKHLFKNRVMIEDHTNKVYFYHNEANKTVEKILMAVYQDDNIADLAKKRHVAYFAMKILSVSEQALKVAKKLVFYMIKSDYDT